MLPLGCRERGKVPRPMTESAPVYVRDHSNVQTGKGNSQRHFQNTQEHLILLNERGTKAGSVENEHM